MVADVQLSQVKERYRSASDRVRTTWPRPPYHRQLHQTDAAATSSADSLLFSDYNV